MQLKIRHWSHVAIAHGEGQFVVYINAKEVFRIGKSPILKIGGPIFASAPWFTPAVARISDVRYVGQAIPQAFATKVFKEALHPTHDEGDRD